MPHVRFYHAHIYFEAATRTSAESLREKIQNTFQGQLRIHGLIDLPIGPHPLPMFEVDIPSDHKEAFHAWLTQHHGVHSVLIHPLSGDDLADHRDYPEWVGVPLKLNLEFWKE